jgi:hypothetical protein
MTRFLQVILVLGLAFAAWSRFSAAPKQPIAWQENISTARSEARRSGKLLFVYFHLPT